MISVIVHHSNFVPSDEGLSYLLNVYRDRGFLGVDLFFILSGFLVGGLLIDEHRKYGAINIPRFLIRRGLKIYPAYLAFLGYLILFPCLKALMKGDPFISLLWEKIVLFGPNFIFVQNYFGTNPAGHTWTLAVEEHFYLTIPLIIAFVVPRFGARVLLYIAGTAVITALALRYLTEVGHIPSPRVMLGATHHRIDALFVGVGIRYVFTYNPGVFASLARFRWLLLALAMFIWSPFVLKSGSELGYRTVGILLQTTGASLVLISILSMKFPVNSRAFSVTATPLLKGIAWIGLYSYGIYLWHVTATRVIEREWLNHLSFHPESSPYAWSALQVATISGSVILGFITTKLIEAPFLKLRDRIYPSRVGVLQRPKVENVDLSAAGDSLRLDEKR